MKSFARVAGACLMTFGGIATAAAQAPIPGQPYPLAVPHEVRDGCRTVLDPNNRDQRIPVDCGPAVTGSVGVPVAPIPGGPMMAPGAAYPLAVPHEVRDGCRTVLDPNNRDQRIPVDCPR